MEKLLCKIRCAICMTRCMSEVRRAIAQMAIRKRKKERKSKDDQITVYQHYVPCELLKAWSCDGVDKGRKTTVITRIGRSTIAQRKVNAICAENNAYGYKPLSAQEFKVLHGEIMFVLPRLQDEYANSIVLLSFGVSAMDMISKRQFDAFRNFWDSVRTLLPLGDRVKKELTQAISANHWEDSDAIIKTVKILTKQGAEMFHTNVENQFRTLLKCLRRGCVHCINSQESFRRVFLFMIDQLMRTNASATKIKMVMDEEFGMKENIWSYLGPYLATTVAAKCALDWNQFHISVIKAVGNAQYIISDNPVIDFASDYSADPFALFMPISPDIAIFVGRLKYAPIVRAMRRHGESWTRCANKILASQARIFVISNCEETILSGGYYAGMETINSEEEFLRNLQADVGDT